MYCFFDNIDNIVVKKGQEKDVNVIDLTLARILLNFIAACFMVCISGTHVTKDVPSKFKCPLGYRSVMILVD